jgi:hypothetical protein
MWGNQPVNATFMASPLAFGTMECVMVSCVMVSYDR